MSYEAIRSLVIGRMAAFTGIPQSSIQYPNQKEVFKPPKSGVWCRITIQSGTAFMAGMADVPCTRIPGQIVIQCFDRTQAGEREVTRVADELIRHFQYWSSGHLECLASSMIHVGDGGSVGNPAGQGFYQKNVTIPYRYG